MSETTSTKRGRGIPAAVVGLALAVAVGFAGFAAIAPGPVLPDDPAPADNAGVAGSSSASVAPTAPLDLAGLAEAAGFVRVTEWASPRDPAPVSPVPASRRVPRPAAVRGIYVGSWSVGHPGRLASLLRLADDTEINTFVVDIKEAHGEVSHRTRVPLATQVGADRSPAIADLRGLVTRLRARGIYPVARIVVFKDPLLADARPDWAIRRADGTVWEDDKGVRWVDPFNREVWDYNIELAREAIAHGFSEVQWDYVRFPDVPASYLVEAHYPARNGRTMTEAIREFIVYSRERLADPDVPITADVFGITTSTRRDVGIGQVWEMLADVTDALLPMVYPSHYPRGSWGFDRPNAEPYAIVRRAVGDGVERSRGIPNAAAIIPWLQAFTLGEPPYGAAEIREQIRAVYDAGVNEWVLWSPSVRYPRGAFEPPAP